MNSALEMSLHLINGCMLGLELLSARDIGDEDLSWGVVVDLVVFRMIILKWKV